MSGRRVRVFHISDLHMRGADGPQGSRARREATFRWRVLGQKWTDNLTDLRKDGTPFDLVVFMSDLADWGHPTDYPRGIAFLKETCEALEVPIERLFVVPGNHDIDRNDQSAAWAWMRQKIGSDPRSFSDWMAGGEPRALRRNRRREQVLQRRRRSGARWRPSSGGPSSSPGIRPTDGSGTPGR